MPHKRAKRSTREELRRQRSSDLAPGKDTLNNEGIPKSAARVLNAAKIREEWRSKRKRLESDSGEQKNKRGKVHSGDDTGMGKIRSGWKIQPGEPIQHFNRRVEDEMRPIVRSAIQASKATVRHTFKAEMEARQRTKALKQNSSKVPSPLNIDAGRSLRKRSASPAAEANVASAKEFAKAETSLPRRLNDVAQAPPSLTTLRFSARKLQQGISAKKHADVLSMAQRSLMEREREQAVQRYRQLKATKRKLHAVKGVGEDNVSASEDAVASS